jgi:hypothetical protein
MYANKNNAFRLMPKSVPNGGLNLLQNFKLVSFEECVCKGKVEIAIAPA